jgi:hypothetical protein
MTFSILISLVPISTETPSAMSSNFPPVCFDRPTPRERDVLLELG